MIYLWGILVFSGLLVGLTVLLTLAEKLLINYGTCTISINSGERMVEVEGGQTLLSALIGSNIFIPSACGGRGSCGYCKIAVLSGGGPLLPTETPFLNRAEIRSSMRLACQVKIREDVEVKIAEELLSVQLFSATVASTREVAREIKEIRLALKEPEEISFNAGQYVQVQAPSPDGPVFRAYSISSPTHEHNQVELVVRLVPEGIGSTYLHSLKEGDPVTFAGPYGEFEINEDPEVEMICVGGGCGMAPMKNIVFTLYKRWPSRPCRLFFGCRNKEDAFYLDEFKALAAEHPNFRVIYALSEPTEPLGPGDSDMESGFIHLAVDKHLEPNSKRQAFLCGPPPMINAVTSVLKDKDLKEEDIFYDKF